MMMKKHYFLLAFAFAIPASAEDVKQEIIDRCRSDMGDYGASMVKACVDQDIEAIRNINKIPDKYNNILARCMRDMRDYGYSMVFACAKQDIEAEEALSRY